MAMYINVIETINITELSNILCINPHYVIFTNISYVKIPTLCSIRKTRRDPEYVQK